MFTTKGPSLKSHSLRNRLNTGPGETERSSFKRIEKKKPRASEALLQIRGDIAHSYISPEQMEVEGGEMITPSL